MAFQFVVIASVVPHFFASGPAAVFGNSNGGKRGAILAAAISSMFTPLEGQILISSVTTWGEMDYGILGSIIRHVGKSFIGK